MKTYKKLFITLALTVTAACFMAGSAAAAAGHGGGHRLRPEYAGGSFH